MSASTTQLLESLSSLFGKDKVSEFISFPGSEEYDKSNGSHFSALASALQPSLIVKPDTTEQVQGVVRALRPHVIDGSCRLAIRNTGHTPFAGSANIQDGVTIDLRNLKGITLSPDMSTVELGVGETWAAVYSELEKYGLTTAGGRVSHIGVGGFLLGGGLSMISSRVGFACDSVTEFKVVLASGELFRANASENADLWTSLKGGLNNFGIITSVTMKAYSSADIWGGLIYYAPDTFPQLLQGACDFLHESDEDAHLMCSVSYAFGHLVPSVVMYDTQGKVNPPSLQRFTAVQPQIEQMSSLRTSTVLGFTEELGKLSTAGKRQYWASISIKPDLEMMQAFSTKWQSTVEALKDVEGFIFTLGFHPLTKSLLAASAKTGGNAMNITPSDGPLFVVLINPIWVQSSDDARIFAAIEGFLAELRKLATEKGLLHRYIFTNYAYWKDDVLAGYGEESVERMKAVSGKYDPEGMFQVGVPGGFKLR